MNKQKFGVRMWLWIVLAVVIVISLGWIGYQKLAGNKTTLSLASPTPTKSVTVSPSSSAKITTSPTASTNQTAIPAVSPTSTLPTGWKTGSARIYCPGTCYVDFSVSIKEVWAKYENDTNHSPVFYTSNNQCVANSGEIGLGYTNCYDDLAISLEDISAANNMVSRGYDLPDTKVPYTGGKIWVNISKSVSEADQQIIFDSFKIISATIE